MARIFIIDDEANIRMMMRLALTQSGYEAETAADGFEGLERFGNGEGWDLVMLDQRMPGMEGIEVLREMRRLNPAVRTILITAFGTIDLANEARKAGATDFLRKPFTVETLRGAVQSALKPLPSTQNKDSFSLLSSPLACDLAGINGFRIIAPAEMKKDKKGEISGTFAIYDSGNTQHSCHVVLPPYMIELIKAHADRDDLPNSNAFYRALCGEVLANYLWQNADFPPDGLLRIEDLTSGLRHWMDAVLASAD